MTIRAGNHVRGADWIVDDPYYREGVWYYLDEDGVEQVFEGGGDGGTTQSVIQPAHGFVIPATGVQAIPVYRDVGRFVPARAITGQTATTFIVGVTGVNSVEVGTDVVVDIVGPNIAGQAYTDGAPLMLSQGAAGTFDLTPYDTGIFQSLGEVWGAQANLRIEVPKDQGSGAATPEATRVVQGHTNMPPYSATSPQAVLLVKSTHSVLINGWYYKDDTSLSYEPA